MKKSLPVIVTLAAAAAVITPKLVANNIETTLNEVVAQLNQTPMYQAKISELNSQWFSTSAKIALTINLEEFAQDSSAAVNEPIALDIAFNADHGPVLLNSPKLLGLVNWSASLSGDALPEQMTLDLNQADAIYRLDTVTDLFGKSYFTDNIPGFSVDLPEKNIKLAFSGYKGTGGYVDEQLNYKGLVKNVNLVSDKGTLNINDAGIDMSALSSMANLLANNMYDSTTDFTIGSITFEGMSPQEQVSVTEVKVAAISTLKDNNKLADIAIKYGVEAVDVGDFHGEGFALDMELNNLSSDFLAAYQENMQQLGMNKQADSEAMVRQFFSQNLLALLQAQPELNITRLAATLEQGSFSSSVHSSLAGINALPEPLDDPSFWLAHALVNGEMNGDKAVIEHLATQVMLTQLKSNPQAQGMSEQELTQLAQNQVPVFINNFVQQGFLLSSDTHYSTAFSLKNKEFKVNDKVIPLTL